MKGYTLRQSSAVSRRRFLASAAAAAVATGLPRGLTAQPPSGRRFVIREDRFGRMFPGVEPFFRENTPRLQEALRDIGKPGGMLDAQDELGDGGKQAAINLIVDPNLSVNNPNNPSHTAGTTFIGQFLDHDMTFDLTSRLAVVTEPLASPNDRTPAFDLDSVYGGGPMVDQELYVVAPRTSRERATKLRIESGGLFEDLPRNSERTAIIADPRNDENMMIAGLHSAFILAHNNAVDLLKDQHVP